MTSPRKIVEVEKEKTMFGQLSNIEKQTASLSTRTSEQIQQIKRLQIEFSTIEKEARASTDESRTKLLDEVKSFEERIKNYLLAQKAQYTRFATQINTMIGNSKDIENQLTLLESKFQDFQKNVGL